MIVPDTQLKPGVPMEHLRWAGEYLVEKQFDTCIVLGDWADMPSLSSYDKGKKSFEGRRYKADIEAAIRGMELFTAPLREYNAHKARLKEKQYKPRLILCLGNHEERILRAIEDDAKLEGVIGIEDLKYESFGFEVYPFLEVVMVDGIAYSHYFTSGVMGRPVTSARALVKAKHCSAVMGHVQACDVFLNETRADGTPIIGIFAGTFYQHQESYLGPQGNFCRRQLVVLNEVDGRGGCDPMFVSMDYLRRKYGQKAA